MTFTWAFFTFFILLIVPGLLTRRLFFYSEFSKQFGQDQPISKTFGYSILPGFINAILSLILFHFLIDNIDIDEIITYYRELNSENIINPAKHVNPEIADILTFIGFNYFVAIITGILAGRFIRIFRLDTTWKIFRYKNYWFYLFSGEVYKIKKYKHTQNNSGKFLFTQVDVLTESATGEKIYSGIVVDYELDGSTTFELSKLTLRNAHKYINEGNEIKSTPIPGNLLVIDCRNRVLNLNLTYVFDTAKKEKSNVAKVVTLSFGFINLLMLPIFLFKMSWIDLDAYHLLLDKNILERVLYYLSATQLLSILNPYYENTKNKTSEYRRITWKVFLLKMVIFAIIYAIARWID